MGRNLHWSIIAASEDQHPARWQEAEVFAVVALDLQKHPNRQAAFDEALGLLSCDPFAPAASRSRAALSWFLRSWRAVSAGRAYWPLGPVGIVFFSRDCDERHKLF
jgi:hypothetical protein